MSSASSVAKVSSITKPFAFRLPGSSASSSCSTIHVCTYMHIGILISKLSKRIQKLTPPHIVPPHHSAQSSSSPLLYAYEILGGVKRAEVS